MSHPTWVRGLKLSLKVLYDKLTRVAPYVGAWIETINTTGRSAVITVAPYVGAWIETGIRIIGFIGVLSHPTWVRGLKPKITPPKGDNVESHPTWVRGLKLHEAQKRNHQIGRTLRGCVD